MRSTLLVSLLLPLLLARLAFAQPVAIGSPPPALDVQEWIDRAPSKSAAVSVVMFTGTWCPVTRNVLDHLDARAQDLDAQILAITQEDQTAVQRYLDIGGWSSVVMGTDPERRVRAAWFGDANRNYFVPYAFVVAGRGKGKILWHGRIADAAAEAPMAHFDAVLTGVAEGTWTLDGARKYAANFETATALLKHFEEGPCPSWYTQHLDTLEQIEIPRMLHPDVARRLNQLAWNIATNTGDPGELAVARRAIDLALAHGGDRDPAIVDTQARVLWEQGEQDEALAAQQRAVDLARGGSWESELVETLCEYARSVAAPLPDDCRPGPWIASINESFDSFPGDRCILVRPATQKQKKLEIAWVEEVAILTERFFQGTPVRLPDEVTDAERMDRMLVLYGTPESNPLTKQVLDHHGITLTSDQVTIGSTTIPLSQPYLIVALPSPWNPRVPTMVYTALDENHAHDLNRVFHGPTSVVMGSADGGSGAFVLQANVQLDDNTVVGLDLAPALLSADRAVEDLDALNKALQRRYAGYADLQWGARARGETWEDHTDTFRDRLASQDSWKAAAFFDVLRAYLQPVQDAHFRMVAHTLEPDGSRELHARLVSSLEPYFADGVVGAAETPVPHLPSPADTRADVPYLFPTWPTAEHDPAYLVGVLADPSSLPRTIDLERDGTTVKVPVHRGRARATSEGRGWSVQRPPESPLPVLRVTTMSESALDGLAASADSLRQESAVVLDLRGNGGGADSPARAWCSRFTRQWFRWGCHSQVVPGEAAPLRHWFSGSDHAYIHHGGDAAQEPYEGQLFVLIDTNVASSGETFTLLSSQIEGAILVGENTAGCMDYGNADQHLKLPHSRFDLYFGRSRFVWQCVRPAAEGTGIFPDYWLDVEDPMTWLSEHAVEPAPTAP